MPISDISNEYCTLIGVNCVIGEEKESIGKEWNRRFSPYRAFLVEAAEEDGVEQIVGSICSAIAARGIASIEGNTCILAIFMDLTGEPKPQLLDAVSKIPTKLNGLLHCNMAAVLQFGYSGKIGLTNGAPIRTNIQAVIATNEAVPTRTQLILVSKPALAELSYSVWLPQIVLLDILRRHQNPTVVLPFAPVGGANNDIGFLSYNEYNHRVFNEYQEQAKYLQESIGDGNKNRFSDEISRLVGEYANKVAEAYPVDGTLQPQHPGMKVPDNKVRKAQKGKYEPYTTAAMWTEGAVEKTGRTLAAEMKAQFALFDDEAGCMLQDAIKKSGLGLLAAKDRNFMLPVLTSASPEPERPNVPSFREYKANWTSEIDAYLKKVQKHAIYEGRMQLYKALQEAYLRINSDDFEKQINKNKNELAETKQKLNVLFDYDDFYKKAVTEMLPLRGTFSAVGLIGAKSTPYFLICGERLPNVQQQGYINMTQYFINEKYGNIQVLDDAPLKMIRLTLLDCTQQNLETLIKE